MAFYRGWKEQKGSQGNRQGKRSINGREDSWWAAGLPGLLQEIESYSLYAKVAETNGWERAVLFRSPSHWCLSGSLCSSGGSGRPGWLGRRPVGTPCPFLVETHICLSRHIKTFQQQSNTDSVSLECSGCLHNQKDFIASSCGEIFLI